MKKISNAIRELAKKINGVELSEGEISEVIKAFAENYRIEVSDMTKLTSAQCASLSCGSVIIKNQSGNKHAYIVSFKQEGVGMCITYTDAENVETVSYDYTAGGWVYNSTDITHIASNT